MPCAPGYDKSTFCTLSKVTFMQYMHLYHRGFCLNFSELQILSDPPNILRCFGHEPQNGLYTLVKHLYLYISLYQIDWSVVCVWFNKPCLCQPLFVNKRAGYWETFQMLHEKYPSRAPRSVHFDGRPSNLMDVSFKKILDIKNIKKNMNQLLFKDQCLLKNYCNRQTFLSIVNPTTALETRGLPDQNSWHLGRLTHQKWQQRNKKAAGATIDWQYRTSLSFSGQKLLPGIWGIWATRGLREPMCPRRFRSLRPREEIFWLRLLKWGSGW